MEPIPASFYDEAYYTAGTKSNYLPYGPGEWADWIAEMVVEYDNPASVIEAGCAYGFVTERLRAKGVDARGFDISDFAVRVARERGLADVVALGDASDPATWPAGDVELFLACELGEHLIPDQVDRMLAGARTVARRALLLVGMFPDGTPPEQIHEHIGSGAEKDLSHINVTTTGWWVEHATAAGWEVADNPFNDDNRSRRMEWSGRFLYLR